MKRSLLIATLGIFILISATAMADTNGNKDNSIGSLNFTDRVVYVLDHDSNPLEGNWISMSNPHQGRSIQLPKSLKVTYQGPNSIEYGGVQGTLGRDKDESYSIKYPSVFSYLPVYLPEDNVSFFFYGNSSLEGNVDIYLFKLTSNSLAEFFDALASKDIDNLNKLFQNSVGKNYTKYSAALEEDGDLLDYDFGILDAGQYCIVMLQKNEDNSLTILSSTIFLVAENELLVYAPESVVEGDDLNINISSESIFNGNNSTYGAVLIREGAYKANIEIYSNGTKNGTIVKINDADVFSDLGVNSSNFRSKLTKNELQKEIQTIIGAGNGSIAIGEAGQKTLSITTLDLPEGYYYLFVAEYKPGRGVVGLTQLDTIIISQGDSNDDHSGDNPICSINFTDKVIHILNHNSDPREGNWIILGDPCEGRNIQLPSPIKFTYSGPNSIEYGGASGNLYRDKGESYTIRYPSIYSSLPVYLPGEDVRMSFFGNSTLEGNVDIYQFKLTSDSAYGLFDAFREGETGDLNSLFHNNMDGYYKKYSTVLGENGDLLDYDLGSLDAGQYCIVMVKENRDNSLTILSSTALIVSEYELCVSSPEYLEKGKDLEINVDLEGATEKDNYTFGAVLISDKAYRAEFELNSDGTRNRTSVIINDMDILDESGINSSNYRSKLNKGDLQKQVQSLIGEGNGSLAIGERCEDQLSVTAFDLPAGNYYLIVGAYVPGKGLVGISQLDIDIKPKGSSTQDDNSDDDNDYEEDEDSDDDSYEEDEDSNDDNYEEDEGSNDDDYEEDQDSNNGSNNKNKDKKEPKKNVQHKEQCKKFITKGSHIKFEFTKNNTCVNYLAFDSRITLGTTIATIEELKDKSTFVSTVPEGEVYKYFNVRIGDDEFSNPDNLKNGIIGFKVNKAWINENHINGDSITLQHFNKGKWKSLSIKRVKENKEYIYFEAKTPSFSPFAITAKKNTLDIEKKEETPVSSEVISQEETKKADETSTGFQENKNHTIFKIVSFFIGLLLILAVGTIVIKKKQS